MESFVKNKQVYLIYLKKGVKMKKVKKILLMSLLANSLISSAFATGIPVVDGAAITDRIIQRAEQAATWAKEATRWQETIAHYQKQLQAYSDQLQSQTGIKDSVSSLKSFKQIYSDFGRAFKNIQDFNNMILQNPESFLTGKIGDAYKKYTLFDRCATMQDTQTKSLCMVDMLTYVAEEQSIQDHQTNLSQINDTITQLDTKLRNSKDIKESQDIANALASEGLKIQMIQASIEADNRLYETKRRQKEEQYRQMFFKRLENKKSVTPEQFSNLN